MNAKLTGILQVLAHRLDLLLGLERGQLQAERTAVLVGQEVVELRRVRIHAADKVLHAIQLNGGDTLTYGEKSKHIRTRTHTRLIPVLAANPT